MRPQASARFLRTLSALLASLLVLAAAPQPAAAEPFRIDIRGVGERQVALALPTISAAPGLASTAELIRTVVESDLRRTAAFALIAAKAGQVPTEASILQSATQSQFKALGADFAVGSQITTAAGGQAELRFRVVELGRGKDLGGLVLNGSPTPAEARRMAHRMADYIYEQTTGEPGFFSSRIAYVSRTPGQQTLMVADSDGENGLAALRSKEPIISVTWSPDGRKLAYVSFETGKPVVFTHDIATGARRPVANFKGSNSAPAWSPDGSRLAVVLTRDGGSNIFLVGADGGEAKALTFGAGINTEPTFSADGSQIYFTSDRGGGPQIYRMSVSGGQASRVTFSGAYNARPVISPDGRSMAFVSRRDNGFRIVVMNLATGKETAISDGPRDESPSFAPNSQWVIYSSSIEGREVLAASSIDGRVRSRLSLNASGIRNPAWGQRP